MTAIHLNFDLNDPAIARALREAVEAEIVSLTRARMTEVISGEVNTKMIASGVLERKMTEEVSRVVKEVVRPMLVSSLSDGEFKAEFREMVRQEIKAVVYELLRKVL